MSEKKVKKNRSDNKARIKELTIEMDSLKTSNQTRTQNIQTLQQQIAQVNSLILMKQGAVEELTKQVKVKVD